MGRLKTVLRRILNVVPPEEMAGIQLEGSAFEVATHAVDQAEFFRALLGLVSEECRIVLEGGVHPPALKSFLSQNAIPPQAQVARGTVWPRGTVVHLPATAQVLTQMAELAAGCAAPELCYHLHVYDAEGVVLQWYDAFAAPLFVSRRVPVERLEAFCRCLNTSFTTADPDEG